MNLTAANFQSTVEGDGLVLIDFWASWCGPCRSFGPVFEKVSERHPDATFAKVDTEAEQELAGALGISSIPTLMIFRDNVLLFAQPGALPENALENLVEQAKKLDMDEVRAEIDKQKGEAAH
jgi:thioredoxin 1